MNTKYPAKSIYNDIDLDLDETIDNLDIDETIDNDYEDLYRLVKDAYLDSIRSKVWD